MKLTALFLLLVSVAFCDVAKITPNEAAKLVAEGKAILIDVREPNEWAQTGAAAPARLLSKSDFDGEQKDWKPVLASASGKRLIVYCQSGRRAGVVGTALASLGHSVSNAGSFDEWKAAGLPVRQVKMPVGAGR